MDSERHGDEESNLLEKGVTSEVENNSNTSNRRVFSLVAALALCFVSITFISSTLRARVGIPNELSFQTFADAVEPWMTPDELLQSGNAAEQTVTYIYVKGKLFECDNELITTHCKPMPEVSLHDPSNTTKVTPIIYSTLDLKYNIIEFKNVSYMCPNDRVNEETCVPKDELRKSCAVGEYNFEVIATETTDMYYKCTQCPVGTYQDDPEFLGRECTPCPEGTWVNFVGAVSVDRCTAHAATVRLQALSASTPVVPSVISPAISEAGATEVTTAITAAASAPAIAASA